MAEKLYQYIVKIQVELTGPKDMGTSLQKSLEGYIPEYLGQGETFGDCRVQFSTVSSVTGTPIDAKTWKWLKEQGYIDFEAKE